MESRDETENSSRLKNNYMPDVSMCSNQTCPMKEYCYRFKAVANSYQSYGGFKPDENGKCDYFIELAAAPNNNN
jgi:hypothetical protein